MGRERPPLLMRVVAPLAVGAMRCVQDVRISGAERIPEFGPVLVVSNHTCHLDALSVCMALYRRGRAPVTAGRADLFTAPVLGWALRRLGQIPVYRSDVDHVPADGGSPASSLRAMSDALAAGRALVVFPESTFTRDPDGWPMRGKTGSARLALAHPDAVVLPVAHWGNEGSSIRGRATSAGGGWGAAGPGSTCGSASPSTSRTTRGGRSPTSSSRR